MRPGESKTSQRRLAGQARQSEALGLRKRGMTFRSIAEELGYAGPPQAYMAVMAAIKRVDAEPAAELRTLENERMDVMLDGIWEKAKSGDEKAVAAVIRLMQRRAKLMGLDLEKEEAPTIVLGPLVIQRSGPVSEETQGGDDES